MFVHTAWKKKWSKLLLVLLLVCASLSPAIAQAATPYKTYTMDGYGYVTETQTAYTPYQTIEKIGEDADCFRRSGNPACRRL